MTGFWDNVTGTSDQAFSKEIVDILPHGTQAIGKIVKATNESGNFGDIIQIQWELTSGEFAGRHLFQKLYVFDTKPERQLKARNMLKYLLDLFQITVSQDGPPTNQDLMKLIGKFGGLKIMEWQMDKDDGSTAHGNSISEVHSAKAFESVTGKYREFKLKPPKGVESALTRNSRTITPAAQAFLDDELPF